MACSITAFGSPVFAENIGMRESFSDDQIFPRSRFYVSEDNESSSNPFSWMPTYNLGTFHKVLGYTALLSGLTAIGTGIGMTRGSGGEDDGSSPLKSVHRIAATGAAIFTITAFTTGALSYASQLDFGDGINTYNSHALLGTLASIGFIAALSTAPSDDDGSAKHCGIAEASGGLMLGAVIIIQF
jgi:hypothetical protein